MKKIITICCCVLILGACATKDYSPNDFKKYTAKQILAGGEETLAKGNYAGAVKYFEAIDALYPFDPEAKQGQLDVIYAYYKAEDYASALAAANRYIHLYPEGRNIDYIYYMKGIINFDKDNNVFRKLYPRKQEKLDTSNLREAFLSFSELIKKNPHSRYAKDAKMRMLYIRNTLAEHDLYIAKFYFERKAYVAAANRASYVVEHFEGVPQVKEALELMIKSYRALSLDKQANDALRVLKLNFPNAKGVKS